MKNMDQLLFNEKSLKDLKYNVSCKTLYVS